METPLDEKFLLKCNKIKNYGWDARWWDTYNMWLGNEVYSHILSIKMKQSNLHITSVYITARGYNEQSITARFKGQSFTCILYWI